MLKKVDEIIVAGTKHDKITHLSLLAKLKRRTYIKNNTAEITEKWAGIEELAKDLTAFFQYHKKTSYVQS